MTTKTKQDVVCAKCGKSNPPGKNSCAHCGARTYIACHHCGHSNERRADLCVHCGSRLHRSRWRRLSKRLFGRNPKVSPLQIVLLILFVALAYKVIIYLAEYSPPPVEGG